MTQDREVNQLIRGGGGREGGGTGGCTLTCVLSPWMAATLKPACQMLCSSSSHTYFLLQKMRQRDSGLIFSLISAMSRSRLEPWSVI